MSSTRPSSNGRGSSAWCQPWTQLRIERPSAGYCRVTFDHPPANAVTGTTIDELDELVGLIEQDRDLNVVVFTSASARWFLADFDDAQPAGRAAWRDVLVRLARAPVVSIAALRGPVGGAGGEFLLACDLRLASHDRLDEAIDALAARLARFDHAVIERGKRAVDPGSRLTG